MMPFERVECQRIGRCAGAGAPPDSLALDALERHHILKVLEYAKGNKTEAARLLGIGIATLYRKLESYGV